MKSSEKSFNYACEQYEKFGVNINKAMTALSRVAISLHCWQGDDVGGFESSQGLTGGGIMATGNYPGRARNAAELRKDIEKVFSLIPGKHRVNVHSIYSETGGKRVDRNELEPRHFSGWVDWAKSNKLGLDFNGSFFSHPKAAGGFTLASEDEDIRKFWIEHGIACRKIGEYMGRQLGSPCVNNIWIPDGYKDTPIDRAAPRERLRASLDSILHKKLDKRFLLDAVESKLFGIGSESYVVGSHEFYMGYAMKNNILLCLDSGHFHPTETISDKISSVLMYVDELLLHVSRGIRWDSDHVVILSDEVEAIAQEIVRGGYLGRVHIGLDYFDASINRIAAWAIGARAMLKALLIAMLEPTDKLKDAEQNGDYTARLLLLEEIKQLPFGIVWDYYCQKNNVETGLSWLKAVRQYEAAVLSKRK
ncbi:MAG: L-rhamnose isomerase [Phycisphaerae bacterium]|jgi:L-rhamnose isomerase